jgi:EARP and GARP complex-interacting protein 1
LTKVPNAHYNGILACEFDPFKTYLLSTTGMDYSVKFWDIRNFISPVAAIFNNSHWIWDLKYNKRFSRVMITCSSSSVVRGIVFDKEPEVEESRERQHLCTNDHSQQDYSFIQNHSAIDYVEFDDSVYSLDWSLNDPWTFAAVSYNSYLYINSIPEDVKYQIMLDN